MILVAASVGLALLACEALVRSVKPQLLYRYPAGLYVADRELGYRLAPRFEGEFDTPEYRTRVRINAQGLREDREYGPKGPDTFRILFIGDSFTMGHSVEQRDTFVKLLERLLAHGGGSRRTRYEVINAGVPGYNTEQEISYLEREGVGLAPDLVVLCFFIGNDIRDNALPTDRVRVEEGVLVSDAPPGILPVGVRRLLAAHSHLYHLVWPYQRALLSRAGREQLGTETRARIAIYRDDDATVQTGWAATERQLVRFAQVLRDTRPIRGAVVVIPDPFQVAPANDDARMITNVSDLNLDAPAMRLDALSRAQGIPVLDLLPAFRRATETAPIYFVRDGHLTVEGNRVAARAMMQFLVRHALVPASGERYARSAGAVDAAGGGPPPAENGSTP